jgi:hypothetical protein
LAFNQKNTRKNLENKHTLLVLDPQKILKSRRYLKQIASSTNKIYQPKFTHSNTKDLPEGSNTPPLCEELPIDGIGTLKPGFVIPDFKTETFSIVSFTNRGK